METVLNVLHVLTAVFIVGPMAVLPMTAMRAVRAGDGAQVQVLARSTFIFGLASILVVVLGFGVMGMSKHPISITTPWILISLILWIVALALTLLAVVPALRSAGEHLASADPASRLGGADYKRIAIASGVTTLLLIVVVVLMVAKP